MDLIPLLSAILVTTALFAWVNHRFLSLPTTIGVLVIALVMSLGLLALDALGTLRLDVRGTARELGRTLPFTTTLMQGMLSFLLFAGALHVDLTRLWRQRGPILLLATVGVVVTTGLVGLATWLVFGALGLEVGPGPCLLFGALISPTDPIAVLSILRQVGVPPELETKIAGESLFNDGIGVVVFTVVLGLVAGGAGHGAGAGLDAAGLAGLFAQEVLGGIGIGLATGALAWLLLRSVADGHVELLVTLALAAGTHALALAAHASGPLAVVAAGLAVGHTRSTWVESQEIEHLVHTFWTVLDELLNAVLFVLIGLELVLLELSPRAVLAGVLAIPVVLGARAASVTGTVKLLERGRTFTPGTTAILTWGGLRGGISIALALTIPSQVAARDTLVVATYVVVVFSILVQGLSIGRLVAAHAGPAGSTGDAEPPPARA